MKFVDVAVDFFLVVITTKVSDRQSVRSLAVAVAYGAISQVGRENFVEIVAITKVMGSGMLVRVGAPVTLFPKNVKGATEFIIFFLFTHMEWLEKLGVVTK